MKIQTSILAGVAAVIIGGGFAGYSSLSAPTTIASSYRRARVTHGIYVYRFIRGASFATNRLGHRLYLHPGKVIHIKSFYHMGKDGYMLRVNGHGYAIYYAQTNNSSWFRR